MQIVLVSFQIDNDDDVRQSVGCSRKGERPKAGFQQTVREVRDRSILFSNKITFDCDGDGGRV